MLRGKMHIWAAVIMLAVLTSCGGGGDNKQAKLDSLKKQQAEIEKEIALLEKELNVKGDSTAGQPSVLVAVTAVQPGVFKHYIEVQGKVDAEQNVLVTPKVPGTVVTDVLVERGDKVTKGQVLARLDEGAMSESIAEVQNQYELANTVFQKQKRLWEQKIGTELQYLSAKNNRDALEKRLATMRSQAANFILRSPINGVVDDVNIRAGETPVPGMGGIRVVNMASTKILAEVSEAYAGKVQQGDEVVVVIPDIKKEFISKVHVASKSINTINRSFLIELRPDAKQSEGLQPNMVAMVKVNDYKNADVIILPVNAIQKDDKGEFVYLGVDENGVKTARKTRVKTGDTYNGNTEILSGLKTGDKVITTGYQNVVDGQVINF